MFEARLPQGVLLKRIIEALATTVSEFNFEASPSGLSIHAMDSGHICIVVLQLRSDGFEHFRCDRNMQLGVQVKALQKILKCADNDDRITLRAEEGGDVLTFVFESQNEERISTFEVNLIELDLEAFGIPDATYQAVVKMPSFEFQRVARDLSTFSDSIHIEIDKHDIRFASVGSSGGAQMVLKAYKNADKDDESLIIELQERCAGSFASRYLLGFAKGGVLAEKVVISMGFDAPFTVSYAIAELGRISYFLAPKASDDDEDEGYGDEEEDEEPVKAEVQMNGMDDTEEIIQ